MSHIKEALYSYVGLQISRVVADPFRLAYLSRQEGWEHYLEMLAEARVSYLHSLLFQYTMTEDDTLLDRAAEIASREEIALILTKMSGGGDDPAK